jgi:transposase
MKHKDMRSLPAAAQEERRRQVIGLRERGMGLEAIARPVGLSRTGVFDICKRYKAAGMAGLRSKPPGSAVGARRLLCAAQERELRALIRRQRPMP